MASQQPHEWLPARPSLADGEALDCYLERVAAANDLPPLGLLRLLTAPAGPHAPTTAFLMVKPDPLIVDKIVGLTGIDETSVQQATLLRFNDGLPLCLDRLDPRRRHTCRQVMAQGWFPPYGSQACPLCLSQGGIWQVSWRLPLIAVCAAHRVFLVTRCSGCDRRFRSHRFHPLRVPIGVDQPCGNTLVPRTLCRQSALYHRAEPATPVVLNAALAISQAIAGQPAKMLDREVDPRLFLTEIRQLATLLLHLAMTPQAGSLAGWVADVQAEAAAHAPSDRDRQWRTRPPHSSIVRGNVLAEAHAVLQQPSIDQAAHRIRPWLALITDGPYSPSTWLRHRTTCTRLTKQLLDTAAFDRHRVGRRPYWRHTSTLLRPQDVPQLIDADIYREFFASQLGGHELTGRLYASLSILRAIVPKTDWVDAAILIGVAPPVSIRVARITGARILVPPNIFSATVLDASHALPHGRNFRNREARVRALARSPDEWFERWRTSTSPRRRRTSWPYAVMWMWHEVAQGWVDGAPASCGQITRHFKASYNVFRNSLSVPAKLFLRSLVEDGSNRCSG
ncbi:TniQ family protein [Mycolicibacterium boenickei]